MLVCSCNFITEMDIRETIRDMLDEDCWQLIVPGKLYHAMNKKGRCCGCFPNVVDLIIETTRLYHLERKTGDPKMSELLARLDDFHQQMLPKLSKIKNAS